MEETEPFQYTMKYSHAMLNELCNSYIIIK